MIDLAILALNIQRYERLLSEAYLDDASLKIIRQLLVETRGEIAQSAQERG
jgi:hypothetical protein